MRTEVLRPVSGAAGQASRAGERSRSQLRAQLLPEDRRAVYKVLVPLFLPGHGAGGV